MMLRLQTVVNVSPVEIVGRGLAPLELVGDLGFH